MKRISDLYADPLFQQASFEEQQYIKRKFWETQLSQRPEVRTAAPHEQQYFYQKFMREAPAFEGVGQIQLTDQDRQAFSQGQPLLGGDTDYKRALWLRERSDQGDLEARKEIRNFIVGRRVANETLLGQLALGTKDFIEQNFFQDDTTPELAASKKNLSKMSSYLVSGLMQHEAEQVKELSGLTAGVAGFVENIGLNMLLTGTAHAPGLLTKGLFANLQTAAKGTTGVQKALLGKYAPEVIEAIGGGLVAVVRTMPQMVADGQLQGSKGWVPIVETFGEGFAWDLLFGAGLMATRRVVQPFGKALRKMDIMDASSLEEAIKAANLSTDPEAFRKVTMEYISTGHVKELVEQSARGTAMRSDLAKFRTILENPPLELNSKRGVEMLGLVANLDIEELAEGSVRVSKHGNVLLSQGSRAEAVSFLQNYLQRHTAADLINEEIQHAIRGAPTPQTTILRSVEKKLGPKTTLPLPLAQQALAPKLDGTVDLGSVEATVKTLLHQNGLKYSGIELEAMPRTEFFSGRWNQWDTKLRVPNTILTPAEQQGFHNYVTSWVERNARDQLAGQNPSTLEGLLQSLQNLQKLPVKNLSPLSFQAAMKRLGGEAFFRGAAVDVKLPNGAQQSFASLADANRAVASEAVAQGWITEADFGRRLNQNLGYSMRREKLPNTDLEMLVVRDRNGTVRQTAENLPELLQNSPEFLPKLPEQLAPSLTFVTRNGDDILRVTERYAAGSQQEMRRLLDGFTSYREMFGQPMEIVEALPDGSSIKFRGRNSIQLEMPELGFRQEFTSIAKAKKFLRDESTQFRTLDTMAAEKGLRIDPMGNGNLIVKATDGTSTIIRSKAELHQILKNTPDPEWSPKLVVALGEDIDEQLVAGLKAKLEPVLPDLPKIKDEQRAFFEWDAYMGSSLRPMKSTIEKITKLTGDTSVMKTLRGLEVQKRLTSVDQRKAQMLLSSVLRIDGKPLDRESRHVLMQLLEVPQDKWETVAKQAYGYTFEGKHRRVLEQVQDIYRLYGQRFNVDSLGFLTRYAPKTREFMLKLNTDPKAQAAFFAKSKQAQLQEIFGHDKTALRTMDFFAKHLRLDAFLAAGDNKDIVGATRFYLNQGIKELHMASVIEDAKQWFETLGKNSAVTPADSALIKEFLNSFGAFDEDTVQTLVANRSLDVSTRMANMIRKMKHLFPGKNYANFIDDFADSMVTMDLPSKLQSMTTYATLGARPIRGLTNLLQYNNTLAVFGDYADRALREMSKADSERYIKNLFRKGILNEHILASGATTPHQVSNILEKSLQTQQNVEYLTRAWTAKAAELSFDEALPHFVSGKLTWKQFLSESNMDILSDASLEQVQAALKAGKVEVARDIFQTDAVRMLMFDYTKENYPLAFRGVLGRMFGKFGVYPVGQVDLYQNILARGEPGKRVLRAARVMGLSVATYESFRLAGLNYNGFLFYDPFQFSGGPLYGTMQDALRARQDGPEGAMARRQLARSWRLAVPFSLQAEKMASALESASQGELHKAFIEVMSGSYTPDNLLNSPWW